MATTKKRVSIHSQQFDGNCKSIEGMKEARNKRNRARMLIEVFTIGIRKKNINLEMLSHMRIEEDGWLIKYVMERR